jgi:hypothetical protein
MVMNGILLHMLPWIGKPRATAIPRPFPPWCMRGVEVERSA